MFKNTWGFGGKQGSHGIVIKNLRTSISFGWKALQTYTMRSPTRVTYLSQENPCEKSLS